MGQLEKLNKKYRKGLEKMNYDKQIETLPNFGGWVIYDLEYNILEEFDIYDEMIEAYDYSYSDDPDTVAGYAILDPRQVGNTTLKAAEIYR